MSHQDQNKFDLCGTLRVILRSFPKSHFDEEPWMGTLQKGLRVMNETRTTMSTDKK